MVDAIVSPLDLSGDVLGLFEGTFSIMLPKLNMFLPGVGFTIGETELFYSSSCRS